MSSNFLETNHFFVLEVSPTDKRDTIISKAEEKAFFLEGNICDEAQASLLNPSKRLAAEMDWFCGCDDTTIANIFKCIKNKTTISTNELTGLARLNATLFNFTISTYDDYFEIGYSILDIDEQYRAVTAFELTETFNECHAKAGILAATEDDVEQALNKKREQIGKLVSDKTKGISDEDYIEFITVIAEKCIADEDYDDGVIITDVVDQYELNMQAAIEIATEEIYNHIERIKLIAKKEGIEANITGLISRLKKWDKLVQPLQLKSMTSGSSHQVSENLGYKVRDLCLWLHNEREMTKATLFLINAVKGVFAEIGSLSDVFEEDANTLYRIINTERAVNEIISEIKAIERIIEKWKNPDTESIPHLLASDAITKNIVDDLIAKVRKTNSKIKSINETDETISQLRTGLCISVRDGAIYAHNELHKTDMALSIARVLLTEFGDMVNLRLKLSEDVSELNRQLTLQNVSSSEYKSALTFQTQGNTRSSDSNNRRLFPAVIMAVIIVIIAMYYENYGISSNGIFGNLSSYNQSSETKFTSSVSEGTYVYTDILSIFPAIGIYTEGSSNYTYFVCECETFSGKAVWVYISTSEYKKHFDSNVSTSVYASISEEINFSYSKRIQGEARKADSVMSGISSDTGSSMLIDFDTVS